MMQHPWQNLMHFVPLVDSTMTAARLHADAGAPHGTTVIAFAQTQARGRRGRTWSSPPGHGLTMTTLLRPGPGAFLHTLSLVAAVAVRDAAVALGAKDTGLKWPNDVWVAERKLAGILLEADGVDGARPTVLVGIGLNVAAVPAAVTPEDPRAQAIGLVDAGAVLPRAAASPAAALELLRVAAAQQTAAALAAWTERWASDGLAPVLAAWSSADVLARRPVRAELDGGWLEGVACGLDAVGQLLLRTADGVRAVQSGQVERVRPQKNGPVATPLA